MSRMQFMSLACVLGLALGAVVGYFTDHLLAGSAVGFFAGVVIGFIRNR